MRTGLSTLTLSAEGRWQSSDGQLCMVGCLGPPGALSDRCKSRITLYLPLTFSISQRSPVFGAINSINGSESTAPLLFQRLTTPKEFMNRHQCCGQSRQLNWSYTYSKIVQAREFQRRSKPSSFGINLRKSFFRYPASKGNRMASLSALADELSVEVSAAPHTLLDSKTSNKTRVDIVLLSIGSLFGRDGPKSYEEKVEFDNAFASSSSTYEEIEISGQLSITDFQSYNILLFFEGVYDPAVGQMYLIGCRDIEEFQQFNNDGRNLEGGLDCLIEIKVEYSPQNAEWLSNHKIKFSINSLRSKEDPFYLQPISINTFLLSSRKKFDGVNIKVRKGFEDGLRILLLAVAIVCIRGQVRYTKNQGHPTVYISMVMIGVHLLGFSIPLITGDDVLLNWKEITSFKRDYYELRRLQLFQALDYCIRILLLFAFLEAKDLLKRVLKSRKVDKRDFEILNRRIPTDELVFLFYLLIHIIGFFFFHALNKMYGFPLLFEPESYIFSIVNNNRLQNWWRELKSYGGLVQDFFLLPQVIGNVLWGVQGKPLRKLYYIGYTMIRLLIQAYDSARDPVTYPGSENEFQYLSVESYYKIGNMILSAIVVTLALTVYFQQKNGYSKIMTARKLV